MQSPSQRKNKNTWEEKYDLILTHVILLQPKLVSAIQTHNILCILKLMFHYLEAQYLVGSGATATIGAVWDCTEIRDQNNIIYPYTIIQASTVINFVFMFML